MRKLVRMSSGLFFASVWTFFASVCAASAAPPFSCGGFASLGGAQLLCSHVDSHAPTQMCTFSWALTAMDGTPTVQQGMFVLPPGSANLQVYQGSGYSGELSNPIVLCQGKRSR